LEGPKVEALVIDCLLSMVVTGTSPVVIPSMGVAIGGELGGIVSDGGWWKW